jgi:hypothetical protein
MDQLANNKSINMMPWYALKEGQGAPEFNRDFSSRIGNGVISSFFRSYNFENTASKMIQKNKPFQVGVLDIYKGGTFQKNKGIVGYLNDSIGQGYGPGTHFLKTIKGLIEGYCRERGMEAVIEKEGVNLIVEVSGGKLPETFSDDLRRLINDNKGKFDFASHKKTINVLDILGKNNINIKFGYIDVPAKTELYVGQLKEAVRQLYENVKFNDWNGKAELGDLLKTAVKSGVKLPVNVFFETLDQPAILNDYSNNRDIFEKSLTTLPDEYREILELALKNREISRSTYEYCEMLNLRFVDVKYNCLNEGGVHLAMERALHNPKMARTVIGITGADELSGQIVMKDGRAYNFSLDINNLGGINREFGVEAGDHFIEAHIKAFNDVRKLVNEGKIANIEDAFVEYYRMINTQAITISKSSISKKGMTFLGVNGKEVSIETNIGNLERTYAKDKSFVNKLVHKGATATVVVTGIEVNDQRGIKRTEEFLRDEVKNLKSESGKDGALLIEVREYSGRSYKSTLVKVVGDAKEVQIRSVERMINGPVNEGKTPVMPARINVSNPVQGGISGLVAGLITYPISLTFNGDWSKFRPAEWGKESVKSGLGWTQFGLKTMGLEQIAGFTAQSAMFTVIAADQLTGIALAPDGQKGRQAVVSGTGLGSFFGGMKVGSEIASKVPAPGLVKMTIPLITGIVASQIGEKGTAAFIDHNWLGMNGLSSNPVLEGAGQFLSPLGMALPGYWWQKEIEPRWQPGSTLGKAVKTGAQAATDIGVTVAEWKLARAVFKFARTKLPGLAGRTLMRLGGIPLLALWLAQQELMMENQKYSAMPGEI